MEDWLTKAFTGAVAWRVRIGDGERLNIGVVDDMRGQCVEGA